MGKYTYSATTKDIPSQVLNDGAPVSRVLLFKMPLNEARYHAAHHVLNNLIDGIFSSLQIPK